MLIACFYATAFIAVTSSGPRIKNRISAGWKGHQIRHDENESAFLIHVPACLSHKNIQQPEYIILSEKRPVRHDTIVKRTKVVFICILLTCIYHDCCIDCYQNEIKLKKKTSWANFYYKFNLEWCTWKQACCTHCTNSVFVIIRSDIVTTKIPPPNPIF